MGESQMPSQGSGNNKTVILLTVGASIIMAAALIIALTRQGDAPDVTPQDSEPPPDVYVPAPSLVATKPVRPLNQPTDTDSSGDTDETDGKPESQRRGKRSRSGGEIDTQKVNQFINSRFGQVKACYERRLKMSSFLEGELDLNIGILGSGKVETIGVNKDTVRDAQMLSCVKKTIRSWTFPKPEGGRVVIGKTFQFKKKGL